MFTSPHRKWFTAVVLAVFVLSAAVPALANHNWGPPYHWARTSNPFTLKLGDNVSGVWDSSLAGASSDWTQSTVLNTTIVAGSTRPKSCRPTSGRVEVCNAAYGGTGWLGIAQIWASGAHITQGVVKLNDTYFNTATYNTPAWRNMVTCQEIGHTFGLAHQDENFNNANLGTCMDYTNNPESNQHPNAHDFAQLESIYSHLDSSTTIGALPAVANGDFSNAASWGQLVSSEHGGHESVYVRDFGNGHVLVTFVIWVQ